MKTKLLISTLCTMMACVVYAQDYSSYLNKAMEKMEAGDCKGAQNLYNLYKELSGRSMSSVEILLADCNQETIVSVGDSIVVGNMRYQVAYVRDGGKHGLAIRNMGWKSLDSDYVTNVTRKGVPTLDELNLIYANRDIIRLYDIYWSCTQDSKGSKGQNGYYNYIRKDFSTGEESLRENAYSYAIILRIYRF